MNDTAKIITAIAAGAVLGAAMGILFAPDKGTETRRKVGDQGKRMAQALKDILNKTQEKMQEVKSNVQQSMGDLGSKAQGMREKMSQYSNT